MAYHFDNTSAAWVEFAVTPLLGSLDPFTLAAYFKRNPAGSADVIFGVTNSTLATIRTYFRVDSANKGVYYDGTALPFSTQVMSSTSTWYLLAVTRAAGATVTPRFHVHDGTSWTHAAASATAAPVTLVTGDRLRAGAVGSGTFPFQGDIVCAGVKKADSSDATVETLSRTAWSAWTGFGFGWLIGFEAIGTLSDQATPGTGDETSRGSGVTIASDPAGWLWAGAPAGPAFVPQIMVVT